MSETEFDSDEVDTAAAAKLATQLGERRRALEAAPWATLGTMRRGC